MRNRVGLPDPMSFTKCISYKEGEGAVSARIIGVGLFVGREPAYAAFVFDGGVCECCGMETENPYISYSLRIRLCSQVVCMRQMHTQTLSNSKPRLVSHRVEATNIKRNYTNYHPRQDWVWSATPVLECPSALEKYSISYDGTITRCLAPRIILDRLSLEEEPEITILQRDSSKMTRGRQQLVEELYIHSLTKASSWRLCIAIAKNRVWIDFCKALVTWQCVWSEELKSLRVNNNRMGRLLASQENWKFSDLMNHSSYDRFAQQKLLSRQALSLEDIDRLRPIIAQELQEFYEKQTHRTVMRLRQKNFDHIWKYYQGLRSRGDEYSILPSFPVFLTFSAVQFLQSLDLAAAKITVKAAGSEGGPLKAMLKHQINSWVEQVKYGLLKTIDPSGSLTKEWKTRAPTSLVPHPVLQPDALWKCRVCHSVEPRYAMDECLDFKGVCMHQCKEKDGNKRGRGKTSHMWSVDNFVRDAQAYAAMKAYMEMVKTSSVVKYLNDEISEEVWLCTSCNPPLRIVADSLVGHSHRHTDETKLENFVPASWNYAPPPTHFGLTQWLINLRGGAKEWVERKIYICCHCFHRQVLEDGPAKSHEVLASTDRLKFNGLRSHLASKHKIHAVRDEDYYCDKTIFEYLGTKYGLVEGRGLNL